MTDQSGVRVAPRSGRECQTSSASDRLKGQTGVRSSNSELPSPDRAVCLQDIADRANVSRATVSLALRNDASISQVTRARIQEIADFLGYRPNALVAALMTYQRTAKPARKTHTTLAMLLRHSRHGAWRTQVSKRLLQAAADRAEQHGYRLEQFWLDDLDLSGARLSEVLYSRGIPGVIVAPLPGVSGRLQLDWSRFSAVSVGAPLPGVPLHRVHANCLDGVREALRRLGSLGYQRIGLALKASDDSQADGNWSAGYFSKQQQLGQQHRVPMFLARDHCWTESNFCRWYERWQPDAVLGTDPGAIEWLGRLGQRVPEDIGFAQISVESGKQNCTGIDLNAAGVGKSAVDLLVDLIRRNERGLPASRQTVLLETVWAEGGTTRAKLARGVPGLRSGVKAGLGFEDEGDGSRSKVVTGVNWRAESSNRSAVLWPLASSSCR